MKVSVLLIYAPIDSCGLFALIIPWLGKIVVLGGWGNTRSVLRYAPQTPSTPTGKSYNEEGSALYTDDMCNGDEYLK